MTREEQKAVRELKEAVKHALKPCCKTFGYKTILDCVYKEVNGYIYTLYIDVYPVSLGKYIGTTLFVKPTVIDNVFWEVYGMADEVKGKPFSFHVSAAHTPYPERIETFKTDVSALEDVPSELKSIFQKGDELIAQYSERFSSLSIFKTEMCNEKTDRLNYILCEIAEENYQEALSITQKELERGESGGFVKLTQNGLVDIYEYIKKYCQEKMG